MSIPEDSAQVMARALPSRLQTLADRLWRVDRGLEWPVVVTAGELPATHTVVEEYAVVPSLARARFLLPSDARGAVASAFTRHLTTPSLGLRLVGAALALGFRTPGGQKVFSDRLVVGIDRRVPRRDYTHWLLLARLADELDAPDLVAMHPVRRQVPSAKPTLRLFDRRGTAQGYAKVGWSESVRRMVRTEAEALRDLDGGLPGVRVPRLLAFDRWDDHEYIVAAPLPPRLRRWKTAPQHMPEAMLRIVHTGDMSVTSFRDSVLRRAITDRLRRAEAAQPEAVAVLKAWASSLDADPTPLTFGRWHGDWVSWNLAALGDEAVAWDWEYSSRSVPVGFDLLHWSFQHRLAQQDADLEVAAQALDNSLSGLSSLGVPTSSHALTASLYLLEMLTRAVSLAAEGNGWNPKLFPSLLRWVHRRAVS